MMDINGETYELSKSMQDMVRMLGEIGLDIPMKSQELTKFEYISLVLDTFSLAQVSHNLKYPEPSFSQELI
jgi:hypothetical protein